VCVLLVVLLILIMGAIVIQSGGVWWMLYWHFTPTFLLNIMKHNSHRFLRKMEYD
jgi:hypothetical protein